MLAALLLPLLSTNPTVAMPAFNTVNVTSQEGGLYAELLSARFAELGVRVVSARDIQTLLGLERQRALLGCNETSCIAELAGALGVDDVLVGDLARVDGGWLVTLKWLSSRDGSTRARFDGQVDSSGAVPSLMKRAAEALVAQVKGAPAPAGAVSRAWAILPGALALATFGLGLWCELSADARLPRIRSAGSPEEARLNALEGKNFELAGHLLLGASATAVLGAIAILIFGGEAPAPALGLGRDGLTLAGRGASREAVAALSVGGARGLSAIR